jgi:hypothetical protein
MQGGSSEWRRSLFLPAIATNGMKKIRGSSLNRESLFYRDPQSLVQSGFSTLPSCTGRLIEMAWLVMRIAGRNPGCKWGPHGCQTTAKNAQNTNKANIGLAP